LVDLDRSFQLNPNNSQILTNRGVTKAKLGDIAGSLQDYNKALQIDPKYARAYMNRAYSRSVAGDLHGAIKDTLDALALDSSLKIAQANLCIFHGENSDFQRAKIACENSVRLNTLNPHVYLTLGVAQENLGDNISALYNFNRAIELDKNFTNAYRNRGVVFEKLGDLPKACSDWKLASSLGSSDASMWAKNQCR